MSPTTAVVVLGTICSPNSPTWIVIVAADTTETMADKARMLKMVCMVFGDGV